MATLPSKRSPESPPDGASATLKKSKADQKRESINRAREWAEGRKRKKDGGTDEDPKKHKAEADDDAKGEERDVLENLPSPRSTRSRNSKRGDDSASHTSEITESSVGSRRTSSRRRTMTAKAASASSSTSRKSTRSRKSTIPAVKEQPVELDGKKEEAVDEVKAASPKKATPKKATPKKATPKKSEENAAVQETEENAGHTEVEGSGSGLKIRSFVPQFSVFLYTIFLQWSVAFAAVLVFFLDWFAFEFHPKGPDADYSNQRTLCAILGFWLLTIAGYSIALGSQSIVGWVLATSSLAMARFAIMTDWGESFDVTLPSAPIYSVSTFEITILDALTFIGFFGWFILYFKEPEQAEAKQSEEENKEEEHLEVEEVVNEKPEVHVPATRETEGPRSFIGDRVAVEKSGVVYLGTVSEYDSDTRLWLVTYEASEGLEDDQLNRLQIASAFRLYSKELSDRLKAMWRANEI